MLMKSRPFGMRSIVPRWMRREGGVLLDVDERRFGGDRDRLGHAGELQRQIDRELLAQRHHRVG